MNIENGQQTISIEEFLKIATSEQKKLLSDIYDNAQKESDIIKKIKNVYESTCTGVYHIDGGISICENEDDADIISLRLRMELKTIKQNIGTLLKKAVYELEMGNVGIIRRQYDNYLTKR